ncbi:MAG: hypothetical protein IPJ30_12675 [Acidobacteria bacterium]|nr:hypothetical protein [Acidobacteriota bacterium]
MSKKRRTVARLKDNFGSRVARTTVSPQPLSRRRRCSTHSRPDRAVQTFERFVENRDAGPAFDKRTEAPCAFGVLDGFRRSAKTEPRIEASASQRSKLRSASQTVPPFDDSLPPMIEEAFGFPAPFAPKRPKNSRRPRLRTRRRKAQLLSDQFGYFLDLEA